MAEPKTKPTEVSVNSFLDSVGDAQQREDSRRLVQIMKDITGLLAGIRGETPPATPYHPAIERRKARQAAREMQNSAITQVHTDSGPEGSST